MGSLQIFGSENLIDYGYFGAWRELFRLEETDPISGFAATPLPHVGVGYGAWSGIGLISNFTFATPTISDECECEY